MGDRPMSQTESAFDPQRNPNTAMMRVLSDARYDLDDVEITHYRNDGRDLVGVMMDECGGILVRTAEAAGFRYMKTNPMGDDRVQNVFTVKQ